MGLGKASQHSSLGPWKGDPALALHKLICLLKGPQLGEKVLHSEQARYELTPWAYILQGVPRNEWRHQADLDRPPGPYHVHQDR